MDDNIELIGRLGQQVANDPALTRLAWTECAIVLSFAADGFCSDHYGYAYDRDGQAHAFTLDGVDAEASASDYVRWLGQAGGGGVRRMLFQFNLDSGRYALAFEHDDPGRWQVRLHGSAVVSRTHPCRVHRPGHAHMAVADGVRDVDSAHADPRGEPAHHPRTPAGRFRRRVVAFRDRA